MSRFKDQAVCIRHIDWSETSQVVALFTREHGKVRGLAKGSKRTSPSSVAKFSGGIELLTRGEVIATTKPTTDLAAITEWDLQEPFHHLRTDLNAWKLGMYAADLVGALTADHDAHPVTFDAMVAFLEALGGGSAKPQAAGAAAGALLRFQWDVLGDCGFKPELSVDVRSGELLDEKELIGSAGQLAFDARAGGVTREAVESVAAGRVNSAGPWRVRKETVALLRLLEESREAGTYRLPEGKLPHELEESLTRANRLLCVYVRAIVDRELPTMVYVMNGERG